ncbi:Uma2 family endonuclease [Gloeobacter morelensis]|uniref:Uma2 family endonuclease n=1 Tax=Gloeobacter morelensis MG652769 TaxID=2781736 RepID=A0ABY3PJZ0_9CYAN|nr:Uma2 family endonuclease [Gloeobacter morelensis]UFP93882.1 Uma2 family endonuclease [Gloeobacter morelensis MG652769]
MGVTLQLSQVQVQPGQRLVLEEVSWQQFEDILEELGDHRGSRLTYSEGTLEIRMPLPEHEKNKVILGDLVKVLLDELEIDYVSFGSTTFKRRDLAKGFEPDDCFYIRNFAAMVGRQRLDLRRDPPPELSIEVDVTSRTQLDVYCAMGVPELWRLEAGQLRIDVLREGEYIEAEQSSTFPDLPLKENLSRFLAMAQSEGPRLALKTFRQWVREQIAAQD